MRAAKQLYEFGRDEVSGDLVGVDRRTGVVVPADDLTCVLMAAYSELSEGHRTISESPVRTALGTIRGGLVAYEVPPIRLSIRCHSDFAEQQVVLDLGAPSAAVALEAMASGVAPRGRFVVVSPGCWHVQDRPPEGVVFQPR